MTKQPVKFLQHLAAWIDTEFDIEMLNYSSYALPRVLLDCIWNVMAHAQKPDFV
jgi:hypothetical protein